MTKFRTLDDADVKGKRVLVRVDLNVPMQDGKVADATRIEEIAPTITELADKGGKVILLSHFGRPKGPRSEVFAASPVAAEVAQDRRPPGRLRRDCIGPKAESRRRRDEERRHSVSGKHPLSSRAKKRTTRLRQDSSPRSATSYVNDAFSAAHRAHASTPAIVTVSACRPIPAAPCRPSSTPCSAPSRHPERPVAAIVGGAKISTKLDLLGHLLSKVEVLIIGGGMANTFLAAQGKPIGKSLCENDLIPNARDILAKAKSLNRDIVLPVDAVVAPKLDEPMHRRASSRVDQVGAERHDSGFRPAQSSSTSSRSSAAPKRWSGTARSAPSRSSRSIPARWRWPRRWRN